MRRFMRMYVVEQRLFFRSPDVMLFCMAMPTATLIIITMISGGRSAGDTGLTYLESSFVALSTVGICCAAFMSIPITLVNYRQTGVLRRMYCSPCSPARLLACDTLASGVTAAISTLILTMVAVFLLGYRMHGNVLLYIAIWLLTMVSMFSIGLMIAALCRTTNTMNVATTLTYFPMLLLSGATIPVEVFPEWFQSFARLLPLGIGIDLLKSISVGSYDKMTLPVIILLAITAVCSAIAAAAFRWE